jgi:methionine-rich copper-binding protein CopC
MVKKFWRACAMAALLAPAMVLAHARLLAASPSPGAQLDTPPKAITLKFDEKDTTCGVETLGWRS